MFPCRPFLVSAGILSFAPSGLAAQQWLAPAPADTATTDSAAAATTSRRIPGTIIQRLPVDSAEGALLLEPGVTGTDSGLSLRGAAPGSHSIHVNGIDITPSHRRVRLPLAPVTLGGASAITGPMPAWAGGSGSAAVRFETPGAESRGGRLSYETDRFTSGLGLNRIEAALGRQDRTSRLFVGGMLFGQKSAEFGIDAELVPIFAPAGVDTTVDVPGTGAVAIPAWALARGECDRFEASADPGIASNYDAPCSGSRTPISASSGYRVAAAGDYAVGRATRLSALVLRGRESDRLFDYASINNPANLFGRQSETEVYALTFTGPIGARRTGSWRLSGSRQTDRLTVSPLSAESEADSRDPAGGFMLGGLDFRWDRKSFPVDSALVANYRANVPGTRRSPYELESTDQYRTIDEFLDGPYASRGFIERGGPVGFLSLFEEKRTTLNGSATWRVTRNSDFTLGGEYAKYAVASYDHALTSQAFSDVYIESPKRGALFAEDRFDYGALTFVAGVRYDFFDAGGSRPWVLDTIATTFGGAPNPAFGEYHPFPRINSYTDADGSFTLNGQPVPLVVFREDARHSAWSPTFRAALEVSDVTTLRAGISRSARMPDLGLSFQGINTDLAITNTSQIFGSDLGLERSWATEVGATHRISSALSGDVALYRQTSSGVPVVRLTSQRDPTRQNAEVDLRQLQDDGELSARGLETRLAWTGSSLKGSLSWSWQRVAWLRRTAGGAFFPPGLDDLPASWERPHTVAAMLGYDAPEGGGRGLLRDASLLFTFRAASGTPYVRCDGFGFSDDPCASLSAAGAERGRLPSFRQLDLRFAKRFGSRGSASIFVDARNLLGRRNTRRVYAATGTTTNESATENARFDAVNTWRDEADENGVLAGTSIDLTFAGQGAGGCANWVMPNGAPAAPDCVALVRTEQRWGNGDGIFTAEEQTLVADAGYAAFAANGFYSAPRRIRLGIELGF
ncbi:MAG TPA: TonB-dependent receptor [Gemmatimonadales bacterium]|nr:TonB-dependent receptor [Gemmatimonadales bacterium]